MSPIDDDGDAGLGAGGFSTPTQDEDSRKLIRAFHSEDGVSLRSLCRSEEMGDLNNDNCGLYNGWRISVEQMRGCNTLQCLVNKSQVEEGWKPEPGDDPCIEADGSYFLSGLSDFMPSRDTRYPDVYPPRHGCEDPGAENIIWDSDMENYHALPFHPTCLEVFKRASLKRNGRISTDILVDWWKSDSDYHSFNDFPRDEAVKRGQSQWWDHNLGDEFLAANPCYVPGLKDILQAAQKPAMDGASCVFSQAQADFPSSDIFSKLPSEIRSMVLSQLTSKDIATLRLASRSFRELPQSLFRERLLQEKPWFWEAWSSLEYSGWTTTTGLKFRRAEKNMENELRAFRNYIATLRERAVASGKADANDSEIAAVEQKMEEIKAALPLVMEPVPANLLKFQTTDWFLLQSKIGKNWDNLLGLQNRRRIWNDCMEILRRYDQYKEEGRLVLACRRIKR